ncbi:acetyl-CoA C-acyltransferase, partial [Enterobacter hormaechei]|nr:acetyl-CoA C-acyltransferase [Enterobacter hormaechei]
VPAIPRNGEPRTGLSMGESCELMAQTWQIPRDEQDRLAFESHHKLAAAYEEGWQNNLMTPFRGLTRDQNLRPDIDLEKIGTLKPVFERGSRGTLTAANSPPLTDGASVVLLASEEWAKARGLPI